MSHLSSVEQQIIQTILNHPQHKEGVHVAAIARAIGGDPHLIRYVKLYSRLRVFDRTFMA